jgi:hypothetical protein
MFYGEVLLFDELNKRVLWAEIAWLEKQPPA